MTTIFDGLRRARRPSPLTTARLHAVRFRRLLENARAILDLREDGREKLDGEYIFDRQYVVSLVDGAIERTSALVFDACVLRPEGGERLYAALDALQAEARDAQHFERPDLASGRLSNPGVPSDLAEEPEYRILLAALAWLDAPGGVMALMRAAGDHALEDLDRKLRPATGIRPHELCIRGRPHRIDVVDFSGPPAGDSDAPISLTDVQCRPLAMMLVGLMESADEGGGDLPAYRGGGDRTWLALTADERLSLMGAVEGRRVHVEAHLTGRPDDDFVFVYGENPLAPQRLLPPGFTWEQASRGWLAFCHNLTADVIERCLTRLGPALFAG